jgi:hypothetical protein
MTRPAKVVIGLLLGVVLLVTAFLFFSFGIRGERQIIAQRLCSVHEGAILSLPVEIKHRDVVPTGDHALCSVPTYNVKPLNTALRAVFPEKPTSPPNG